MNIGTTTLGAVPLEGRRCRFRVWAPRASKVELRLLGPPERLATLTPAAGGYFELEPDDVGPGALYTYLLDGAKERPDPASRFQPQGVHGPSQVVDPQFAWDDQGWAGLPLHDYILYEMHVGTFTPEGTFDAIIPVLPDLKSLGITSIELMPVAQFPGSRNWGYDGVGFFAVQKSYGGPGGLRRLVHACHQQELAVVLGLAILSAFFRPEQREATWRLPGAAWMLLTLGLGVVFGFLISVILRESHEGPEFVLLTLAAQLTTIPIMAYHFQRISLVSFIANPFILPAQPAVMILGGLAVLLSLIWFPLGQIAAWVTWPFVVYSIRLVEIFGSIPHGTIVLGELSIWFVIFFYALLFAVTFGWSQLGEWARSFWQRTRAVGVTGGLVGLLIALLLVWRAASTIPDQRLHITFLDVGSADAVLIKTPSGKHVLINGGPSVTTLSDELGRRLPTFNRKLDWLIIAGTGEDDVAALPRVIERYPPDAVLWSGNTQASFSSGVLNEYLSVSDIQVINAEPEQSLQLGNGTTLRVLTAGPRGAILLLEWKNFRALLPIGMSFEALDELRNGATVGPVNVLLLADAGYAASNPEDWISNLNPELVLLSVDAADDNGMPDSEVLEFVKDFELLRTDHNGWIEITTDGTRMWVSVERK